MSKYYPLESHLRRQAADRYTMTFRDIERTLSALLPKSAHRAEWWANDIVAGPRHVQRRAWLNAGFQAHPDLTQETIVFERHGGEARAPS